MYSLNHRKIGGTVILGMLLIGSFLVTPAHLPQSMRPVAQMQVIVVKPSPEQLRRQSRIAELSDTIAKRYRISSDRARAITQAAFRIGETNQVSPTLVLAIIATESSYQVQAKNERARGLMQVVAYWHPKIIQEVGGTRALLTIDANIQAGTKILSEYLAREHGNLRRALRRYSGSVTTDGYATKVRSRMAYFGRILNQASS